MQSPPILTPNDYVAIVCTGRYVEHETLKKAVNFFMHCGWRVKIGFTAGNKNYQLGGTPAERADDFNRFLADPGVRAIFVARGGFGNLDIVDLVDWSLLIKDPKWICGFSDTTVLHSHIGRHANVTSLHCAMPFQFSENKNVQQSMQSIRNALEGNADLPLHWDVENGREGTGRGVLTGGNLSVLYALAGSESEPDFKGKILFLEEIDEYLYHVDRMLISFKRAGKLKELAGLVAGYFSDLNDHKEPFGENARQIILKHTQGYSFPVAFGCPAGHEHPNIALPLGANVKLTVNEKNALLTRIM